MISFDMLYFIGSVRGVLQVSAGIYDMLHQGSSLQDTPVIVDWYLATLLPHSVVDLHRIVKTASLLAIYRFRRRPSGKKLQTD